MEQILNDEKMMKKYDQSVELNYNPNWPHIADHPYRIIRVSGSCKTKLKHQQPNIDKIYFYIKDLFESKYHLLINGR